MFKTCSAMAVTKLQNLFKIEALSVDKVFAVQNKNNLKNQEMGCVDALSC